MSYSSSPKLEPDINIITFHIDEYSDGLLSNDRYFGSIHKFSVFVRLSHCNSNTVCQQNLCSPYLYHSLLNLICYLCHFSVP